MKYKRKSSGDSPPMIDRSSAKKTPVRSKGGFATKMLENRRNLFNKKNKANKLYLNKGGADARQVGASIGTAIRKNNGYKNNLSLYNDLDSTSVNDSEPENAQNKSSHYAQVKHRLKLLKDTMKHL